MAASLSSYHNLCSILSLCLSKIQSKILCSTQKKTSVVSIRTALIVSPCYECLSIGNASQSLEEDKLHVSLSRAAFGGEDM